MKTPKHAMIDIETLACSYDSVILTIGGVKFNPFDAAEPYEPLNIKLEIDDQLERGRKKDPDTIKWWGSLPQKVRDEAFSVGDRVSVEDGLTHLNTWIGDCQKVWSQGPSFDMPILGSLYKEFGMKQNWMFWDERDSRTITALLNRDFKKSLKFDAHSAVADCIAQAQCVQESFRVNNLTFMI